MIKHIDTKVKDWYLKKKAAIEKVEPEYVKILELKPVAAAEVGHRRRLSRRSHVG